MLFKLPPATAKKLEYEADLEEAVLRQQMQHKDAVVTDQLPDDSISKFDI